MNPESSSTRISLIQSVNASKRKLFYVMSGVSIIVLFVFGYLNIFLQNNSLVGWTQLAIGVCLVLNIVLYLISGRFMLNTLILLSGLLLIMLFILFAGAHNDTGVYWFYTYPLVSFFLLGKRKGAYWISLFIIIIFFAFYFFGKFTAYDFTQMRQMLLSMVILTFIIYSYLSIDDDSNLLLREDDDSLLALNEKLKVELATNNAIKERILLVSKDTEDTKKAILNILEDAQVEKEKVEEVSKRLKIATESAKIGVWDWDVVNDKLKWDEQMYVLYGIKEENFGGVYEAWQAGLYPDDKKMGNDAIQSALRGDKKFEINFRVVWPNGEVRTLEAHAMVERARDGKPVRMIGINWDITKEMLVDREKTEFVSLASHQLKTPVGAINWNLEMLLAGDYGNTTDKQKEVLQETYTMSIRMNELINALLNISRIEMGVFIIEPTTTNFIKLCEEVTKEMEVRRLKKGHDLIKQYNAKLPDTQADEKLLRIIFQNLISNAIKYTPEHGIIIISIDFDNENIIFSVANNGTPIPENDQPRIFQKMFRAGNAQEQDVDGNGLGLYIVKEIVENAGGKIWFTSKKGENTIFTCSFPLSGMTPKTGTKQLS